MTLLTFQLRIAWQFVWRSYRRRQTIWSQQCKQWGYWKLTFIQTSGLSCSTRHSCLHGVKKSCTQGRKSVFFLNASKFSFLLPAPRAGPSHVMFVRTSMDSGSRDATKIPSALTDSRIHSFTKMMTLYMCIVAKTIFSQCLTFLFFQCCGNVDVKTRWSLQNQSLDEEFCWTSWALLRTTFMSLWIFFFRHSVDLDFNEEVMKPERFTETPDHAGVNPDTIRVSKWYRKTTLKGDVSHFSSFSRTSGTFVETNLTSEREPIKDDEERLAM